MVIMYPKSDPHISQPRATRNITEEFTKAASKLRTGQLVKNESFTLFEAVGALEIMDSKMDSGYLGPGENHAEALEDDYDVMRELLPEEVVGVMDRLLCHEMAWHMGHPFSQTIFTSIYLNKLLLPAPNTIDEARFHRSQRRSTEAVENGRPLTHLILRAYCLALVKACDLVMARVTSEHYYEEEDFVTELYNHNLLSQFDISHFKLIIDQAMSWLSTQEREMDDSLKHALMSRLEFRNQFLVALGQDTDVKTRSKEPFAASLSCILPLEKSMSLGKPVPDAFSLKLQRKLASTVPPRPMVNIDPQPAIGHLRRFCQDAIDVQAILDYSGPYNLGVSIWTLMSRTPQPSAYIRSLLQTFIVNDGKILGSIPVEQFLHDDLAELVLPSSPLLQADGEEVEIPSDPRFQIAKDIEGFVKYAVQPFVDTFRVACLNRSRVRRTLCHTITDCDNLQAEAEELDTHLRTLNLEPPMMLHGGQPTYSYPLSSWVYHEKLRQLRFIIQLGFELEIYAAGELPGMYWYLSHLCSTHISHIDRIRMFVTAGSARNATIPLVLQKASSRTVESQQAFKRTLARLDRHTAYLLAVEAFALALHALYVLLARHHLLPVTQSSEAYSNPKLRYELRMRPFIPIILPELVPFDAYEHEAGLGGDSNNVVLDRATATVSEARKAWEKVLANGAFLSAPHPRKHSDSSQRSAIEEDWERDVKDSLRACIGASIAIGTVRKAIPAYSSNKANKSSAHEELLKKEVPEPSPNLMVEIPQVGSKARWHARWAVPRVSERNGRR